MNPGPASEVAPRWKRLVVGRHPRRTLLRATGLAVMAFVVFRFVLLPVRIEGDSMAPTYRDGRINFINRLAYRWSRPRRGDVVGVMLSGRHVMLLKRIVGLPGESVAIHQGVFLIDGRALAEPYVQYRAPWELRSVRLDPDEYFVVGDNRGMEQTSHVFGAARAWKILGKVLW